MLQKIKSRLKIYRNIIPKRYRIAKNEIIRFFKKGHSYPKPFYYHPHRNLGYVLVSKVLSTSICQLMLEWEKIPISEDVHTLHHKKFFVKEAPFPSEMQFSFSIVRNPFARLVSAYKNQYKEEGYSRFELYAFGLILGKKRVKNFEHFIKIVCKIPYRLKEVHLIRQVDLIYDKDGNRRIEFIGKMENIKEDWAYIQSKVNLPDLPHANKTEKNDWRDFYTLELAEMVYQHYKKDFDTFGYEDEYQKLMEYIKNRPVKPSGKNWWEISPMAEDRYPM